MYPFEALRPAWEELWAAVHAEAGWTPPALSWPDDVVATWTDPACAVTQACGWPVATSLRDRIAVVGAFTPRVAGAEGCRYRSVIIAARDEALHAFVDRGATVAVNGHDSLSGWISLRVATETADGWLGTVVTTGSHVASLRAVRAGEAELASIDALTWAYAGLLYPELTSGLHQIAEGPLVPALPVIVPATTAAEQISRLRRAFGPAVRASRDELLLDGFCPLDNIDYAPLLELLPTS